MNTPRTNTDAATESTENTILTPETIFAEAPDNIEFGKPIINLIAAHVTDAMIAGMCNNSLLVSAQSDRYCVKDNVGMVHQLAYVDETEGILAAQKKEILDIISNLQVGTSLPSNIQDVLITESELPETDADGVAWPESTVFRVVLDPTQPNVTEGNINGYDVQKDDALLFSNGKALLWDINKGMVSLATDKEFGDGSSTTAASPAQIRFYIGTEVGALKKELEEKINALTQKTKINTEDISDLKKAVAGMTTYYAFVKFGETELNVTYNDDKTKAYFTAPVNYEIVTTHEESNDLVMERTLKHESGQYHALKNLRNIRLFADL